MSLIGSGALNLDLIYEVADLEEIQVKGVNLEPGHETWGSHELAQKLRTELERKGTLIAKSGGGSAANTLCALAEMGFDCLFIGSVGQDDEGSFILSSMKKVDCSLVVRQGMSSLCIIVVDQKRQDRAMFVAPGSFDCNLKTRALKKALSEARLLHMSSIVQDSGLEAQQGLLTLLRAEAICSFDPGEIYAAKGHEAVDCLLRRTDILFSTDYELAQLFHDEEEIDIVRNGLLATKNDNRLREYRFFREVFSPVVVKKMGNKGAVIYSQNGNYFCAARKVEKIVDNTGAGDAFNAGFLAAVLNDKSPMDVLSEAVSLAAKSLKYPGRSWIDHLGT